MHRGLFDFPGDKIKKLAIILFIISVIVYVILAFALGFHKVETYYDTETEFHPMLFFGFLIGGPLLSYVECLIMYGFGEIVDRPYSPRYSAPAQTSAISSSNVSDTDELRKYKKLFDDGIITEEEYNTKKKSLLKLM